MITDHVEVTIEDLFLEHYDSPDRGGRGVPEVSAAVEGPRATRGRALRIVPHPKSLLGAGIIGAALVGAGFLVFKRWFA